MLEICPKLSFLEFGYRYTAGHCPMGSVELIFFQAKFWIARIATTVMSRGVTLNVSNIHTNMQQNMYHCYSWKNYQSSW